MNTEGADMDTTTYVMLGVLTFAVLVLTTIGLTFFFRSFNERTRYLKREIARASGADELEHWKHKLRRHKLSLLPFFKDAD